MSQFPVNYPLKNPSLVPWGSHLLFAHEVQRCITGAAHHVEEGHAEGVALDGHAGHELVEPGRKKTTVGW